MSSLAISKEVARAQFTRALTLARGDANVPEEWTSRAVRIGESRNRTYTPVLGTILLAKATNPNVSAFALKSGGVFRGYSPRSLAKDVFVPLCVENQIDIRTLGAEPFNNQPFFAKSEIHRDLVPANSPDRPDLEFLVDSLEGAERLTAEQAVLAFAAFLRVRLTLGPRTIASTTTVPASLTERGLERAAAAFVSSGVEAGRRGKALLAGCLDLAFPDRVIESGTHPATRSLGDLVVSVTPQAQSRPGGDAEFGLVAVVRARPLNASEMLQFAGSITEKGIEKALYLALSPRQAKIELTDGAVRAADRYQVAIDVYTDPQALVKAAILWSAYPLRECLSRLPVLIARRLTDFHCDAVTHKHWRDLLSSVTGAVVEQPSLPLFGI